VPLEIVDDYRDSEFARRQTGLLFNLPVPPADYEQLPVGVSLCMIVKNEERFLAECLASAQHVVDEIIVVDTGSTDRTVEIAESFGAKIVHREWRNDFAWARNQAIEHATRRWTLVLDADEELDRDSVALVRALRETPAYQTAVYVQIQNVIDDESGAGSTMTHILPRIYPTTPRMRYRGVIHESILLDGDYPPALVSPITILHKGYTQEILGAREKSERNQPLLERAIRENPDDSFAWFNFGIAAVAAGDWETGIESLEKVFAMGGPTRAFHGTAYTMLANGYADGRGDRKKAMETILEGLDKCPDHPNLFFMAGYFCAQDDRFDEAREWYQKAIDARQEAIVHYMVDDELTTWKAPLNMAAMYVKEGRIDDAVPWFERALAGKPDSAMLREMVARAYERSGRIYDAERMWREAGSSPDVKGFAAYVNFLMRRRRFDEAFELVERRRDAIDDRAYGLLLNSAVTAMRESGLGDPEPFARKAIELNAGDGAALGYLDELYRTRGDEAGRAQLRAAEMTAPLVATHDFARRSYRLLQEHRYDEALETARGGLALAPSDGTLLYNAALAAGRLGRDADALAHLADMRDDDKHAEAALVLRAEIERRAGDLDAAMATLARLRELHPLDPMTVRQATLGLATALLEAGRMGEAGNLAALALA
jgi:tetratricopeptide (TPR) repeat protein